MIEVNPAKLEVKVRVAVVEPPAFVAVTVQLAAFDITLGVPVIWPFVVLKLKPVGSDGEIEYEATAPPETVGAFVVIADPTM